VRNRDGNRVAQSAVAGTVQTFGKPCNISHSVGVSRRTDIVGDEIEIVFASTAGRVGAGMAAAGQGGGDEDIRRAAVSIARVDLFSVAGGNRSGDVIAVPTLSVAIASASNACCKREGNVRPPFSALRRIPDAALGLKKNLGGTWLSKTSDKEHATAALGDSEKSRVEHTPLNPIPAVDHENAEDFCKVSSTVRTEKSGNILENKPRGSQLLQDSRKLVKEPSTFSSEPGAFSGDADILAGDAGADDVHSPQMIPSNMADILEAFGIREMGLQHGAAEGFKFHLPGDPITRPLEGEIETADSAKE
jgi:hypothetical protein